MANKSGKLGNGSLLFRFEYGFKVTLGSWYVNM